MLTVTTGELELELERVLLEKSDVQETLAKLETVGSSLEHDKKRLKDEIKKVRPSASPSSTAFP
jgi:predicted nuclease with TOPRIM domain